MPPARPPRPRSSREWSIHRVTRAYPTVALSSRITTGNLVPQSQQPPLTQFFQNNPSLELIKHNIPAYLAAQGSDAFAGIRAADQPAVIANSGVSSACCALRRTRMSSQTLLGLGLDLSHPDRHDGPAAVLLEGDGGRPHQARGKPRSISRPRSAMPASSRSTCS